MWRHGLTNQVVPRARIHPYLFDCSAFLSLPWLCCIKNAASQDAAELSDKWCTSTSCFNAAAIIYHTYCWLEVLVWCNERGCLWGGMRNPWGDTPSFGDTPQSWRHLYTDWRHSLCRLEAPPISSIAKRLAMIAKIKAIGDLAVFHKRNQI